MDHEWKPKIRNPCLWETNFHLSVWSISRLRMGYFKTGHKLLMSCNDYSLFCLAFSQVDHVCLFMFVLQAHQKLSIKIIFM